MNRFCKICGTQLEEYEESICDNCKSSMMQQDNIDIGIIEEFI